MFDDSGYLQPALYIPYSAPKATWECKFYNRGMTATGTEELKTFVKSLSNIFEIVSPEKASEIQSSTDKLSVEGFDLDSFLGRLPETDVLNKSADQSLINAITQTATDKKNIENVLASQAGGEKLSKLNSTFEKYGVLDSAIAFPFMDNLNTAFDSINSSNIKSKTDSYVDGLDSNGTKTLCNSLNIQAGNDDGENRKNVKKEIEKRLNDLTAFKHVDEAALKKVEKHSEQEMTLPVIGIITGNMTRSVVYNIQMQEYQRNTRAEKKKKSDRKIENMKNEAVKKAQMKKIEVEAAQKAAKLRAEMNNNSKSKAADNAQRRG